MLVDGCGWLVNESTCELRLVCPRGYCDVYLRNTCDDDDDDDDDDVNEIAYQNIELIGFIFAKKIITSASDTKNNIISSNFIANNLFIIQNEVADYLNLNHNEDKLAKIHSYISQQNSDYIYSNLIKFRNTYLKKEQKNGKTQVSIHNVDQLKSDWILCYPYYVNYLDFENKILNKLGMFVEIISEINDT